MSSRVLDSMETDCDGRLSSKSRLGCGGSWAQAGATKAAPMSSTAIPVADLAASTPTPLTMSSLRRRALAVTYSQGGGGRSRFQRLLGLRDGDESLRNIHRLRTSSAERGGGQHGKLYTQSGQPEQARAHPPPAVDLYPAREMPFWLPQAESALPSCPPGAAGWIRARRRSLSAGA